MRVSLYGFSQINSTVDRYTRKGKERNETVFRALYFIRCMCHVYENKTKSTMAVSVNHKNRDQLICCSFSHVRLGAAGP